MDLFFERCIELINSHDNDLLESYINNNTEKVFVIIEENDYASLYKTACKSHNHDCISILVRYGMGPENFIHDNDDEWDAWKINPFRMAITLSNVDVDMTEKLMEAGFKTGRQSSCPDCLECGWPETCLFVTLFSEKIMSTVTDDDLTRIIRVSDWSHVLSTYNRKVSDFLGKEEINKSNMDRVLGVICKVIPGIALRGLIITNKNFGYVMDLVSSNIVDIDDLLMETMKRLLRIRIPSIGDYLDVERYEKCLKDLIDYGADITTPFVCDYVQYVTGLPTKKDMHYTNSEWSCGSFEDIVRGIIEYKEENIMNGTSVFLSDVDEVIEALEKVYSHIKFKKREAFLRKRVENFNEGEYPDTVSKMFVELDAPIFSNVMKYIV